MPSAADEPSKALAGRRFAFYPAIRNVEHNEWTLKQETWSEILAENVHSVQEIWIPRNHLGDISSSDSPVLIVGLKRELELKSGMVSPYRERIVEIPQRLRPRESAEPESAASGAPPPPPRSSATEARTLSLVVKALLAGLAATLLFLFIAFQGLPNPIARLFRTDSSTADQRYLALTAGDDYFATVGKLGRPGRDEWLSEEDAELQFRALFYSNRRYVVVLMGGTRPTARYIGTVHDPSRKILDAARMSGGGDTSSMMKNLPEF